MGMTRLLDLTITITMEDLTGDADPGDEYRRYVYIHTLSGEGICEDCAPWVGVECDGTGDDGVPVPPLHPRCKCDLMPLEAAETAADATPVQEESAEWMESLAPDKLASVLGAVRAGLVTRGLVGVRDLYYKGMPLTLEELGYDRLGRAIEAASEADIARRWRQWARGRGVNPA